MLKPVLFLISIFFALVVNAQEESDTIEVDYYYDIFEDIQSGNYNSGNISIVQDSLLKVLVRRKIYIDKKNVGTSGFRIRIYSNNSQDARQISLEIVDEFTEKFPEIKIYREYDNPYFKLYAGDYRYKDDAMIDFKRIKRKYPYAFIVPSFINLPKLD